MPNPVELTRNPEEHPAGDRYRALLDVSRAILAHRELSPLFRDLSRLLGRILHFDFLNLLLYDAASDTMRLVILETTLPAQALPQMRLSLDESPSGLAMREQAPVIIPDVAQETRWPFVVSLLRERGISTACYVPLNSAQRPIGAIGFGYRVQHVPSDDELHFAQMAIAPVGVAVDNALIQGELAVERDRVKALLEITNAVVGNLQRDELFRSISASLMPVLPHDYASVTLPGPESDQLTLKAVFFPAGSGAIRQEQVFRAEGSPAGAAIAQGVVQQAPIPEPLANEGLRSLLCAPLTARNGTLGSFNIASFREDGFSSDDAAFLAQVASQLAIALENYLAFHEISRLRDQLAEEKLYLEDEIRSEGNFGEMVGESDAFQRVVRQIETAAPTQATVLILGETGTGKELVARAIHEWSTRRDRTFIKLNCAAIPTGLLESELFGHERGAFTGAIAQRIGRFELAHKGTLFLDEIGDIPLELQPKLLRALQEHEFERLGSTATRTVDVRLIAATNRDLGAMVANREFRADLYYRLNVFPLEVPPLRERRKDISILARHFVQKFARRMDRRITSIPPELMAALEAYAWPGNVRELENLMERAVILSTGGMLRVPDLQPAPASALEAMTLEDAEREHIGRALAKTDGVLSGPRGAAALLGMKRTTLQSRMKKLGIRRATRS